VNQEPIEPTKDAEMWYSLLRRFSSFSKTVRVVAWMRRYQKNCQINTTHKRIAALSTDEWEKGHTLVIKALQKEVYKDEVHALRAGKPLSAKSHILKLSPFLD
jgi:hypothetical protein